MGLKQDARCGIEQENAAEIVVVTNFMHGIEPGFVLDESAYRLRIGFGLLASDRG